VITYFKVALTLLQITKSIITWLERQSAINEGERRILAQELAAVAAAAQISAEVRADVEKMTDAQVDDALAGDFRP
jgi:hypothetical protein